MLDASLPLESPTWVRIFFINYEHQAEGRGRRNRSACPAPTETRAHPLPQRWSSCWSRGLRCRDDESSQDVTTETPDEVVAGEPLTAMLLPGSSASTPRAPLSLAAEQPTGTLVNTDGVSITAVTALGADDRTITMRRTAVLPEPSEPTAATAPRAGR